jgi:hypothetical protein
MIEFEIGDKIMILEPGKRYPSYIPIFDNLGLINLTDEHYTDLYLKFNEQYHKPITDVPPIVTIMEENYNMCKKVERHSVWDIVGITNHLDVDIEIGWLRNSNGVNVVMGLDGQEKVGITPIKVLRPHKLVVS